MSSAVDSLIETVGLARAVEQQRVAGLLLTYRCSIACAHCLFNCSPQHPRRAMTVEQGVRYLRLLHETPRVVHIAGGEAMLEYDTLLAICRVVPPHFIETNAFWCTDDAVTRRRLAELAQTGVRGLYISADAYHFASVPVDHYLRCRDAAFARFGEANVLTPHLSDAQVHELARAARDPARLAEIVRAAPPRMIGRAGNLLAKYLPTREIEALADDPLWHDPSSGMSCASEFSPETMWEIHLDPDGYLQTCCGVLLGNVEYTPLAELLAAEFGTEHPLLNTLRTEGPVGLLHLAEARGYQREHYVQKCHLCWQVRRFLRPFFPHLLGPDEIYGPLPG